MSAPLSTVSRLSGIVRESLDGLRSHRLRVALSTLGIAWGIVSMVVLLAYGEGLRKALAAGFRGAVSEGTTVTLMGQTSLQVGGERAGRRILLTTSDVEAIGTLPLIKNVSPEFIQDFPVVYGNKLSTLMVRAVAAGFGTMRNESPAPGGRFITDDDVRLRRHVAFIGSEVQRRLFGAVPSIGETIQVGSLPLKVIGVMREKVQLANYGRPDKYCVFIPWTTMSGLIDTQHVTMFVWQARSQAATAQAEEQVRNYLATRYRYNRQDRRAAAMFGAAQLDEFTARLVIGLKLVLAFIGVLTLAIGSVGTMNIMFVNVKERTREIGTRRALGATRRAIFVQFLLEGLVTTLTGGAIGVGTSCVLVWILSPRPFLSELLDDASRSTDIHLALAPGLVLLSTSTLIVVGLLSGLLPALKASRLDPIEALRYE